MGVRSGLPGRRHLARILFRGIHHALHSNSNQYRAQAKQRFDALLREQAMWTSEYFDRDMWFTSEVNIIPDELPAPPCVGDECYGSLV